MTDLRTYIATVHSGKKRTATSLFLIAVLWPLSVLFRLVVALRNFVYDRGITKGRSLGCKVLSVGNLTTGGTGKTPFTIMIAQRLQKTKSVAILSRGYRSSAEHSAMTLRGDKFSPDSAKLAGDELALMAARLPTVWFAIGADRTGGGNKLVAAENIEIAILEDGFQHRQIARDCDIVLVDAANPIGNGQLLPAGPLRENLESLKRAGVVILTRTESVDPLVVADWINRIAQLIPRDRIFRLRTDLSLIRSLDLSSEFSTAGRKVWLFSGIGNPESFDILAVAGGVDVVGHTIFPDHHPYSDADVELLNRILSDSKADCLLTTAKDAVKLDPASFTRGTCGVMEIGIDFVDRGDIFWGIIARSVGAEV